MAANWPLMGLALPGPVRTVVTPACRASWKQRSMGLTGVDGPQVGGAGVGGLVAVVPLKAHGVPEHPQVAVGVHKAGLDMPALGVKRLPLPVAWDTPPWVPALPILSPRMATYPLGMVGPSMVWTVP